MVKVSTVVSACGFLSGAILVALGVTMSASRTDGAALASGAPVFSSSLEAASDSFADPDDMRALLSRMRSGAFSERLDLYLNVAQVESGSVIEDAILASFSQQSTFGRSTKLQILFSRLFEIEPERAVLLLQSAQLPSGVRSTILSDFAKLNIDRSIELLGLISDPSTERLFAYAIIAAQNSDQGVLDRVVAAGRTLDVSGTLIGALAVLARSDPSAAIARALDLTSPQARILAIIDIAGATENLPPETAAAFSRAIDVPELRIAYLRVVYSNWVRTDVTAFLEHLKSRDPNQRGLVGLVQSSLALAASSNPGQTLSFAEIVGGQLGLAATSEALEVLAERNPSLALSYVTLLPEDERPMELWTAIASGYARSDPQAALTWAESLGPDFAFARRAVMTVISSTDLTRAIEIELASPLSFSIGSGVPSWLLISEQNDLLDPLEAANLIAASGVGQRETGMLKVLLERWVDIDPLGALQWMQASESITEQHITSVAQHLGADDVAQVVTLASFVPPEMRGEWVRSGIQAHARYDAHSAIDTLQVFRNESFYSDAYASVVLETAIAHGVDTAVDIIGDSFPSRAATVLAQFWAETDPAAAAEWSINLPDRSARENASRVALGKWADQDPDAASTWMNGAISSDPSLAPTLALEVCRHAPRREVCDF